jgi:outer membrane receptor protein involved in Fe transport
VDQLVQQIAVYYNRKSDLQLKLSGEHYYTRSEGNADLNYFFADASAGYRFEKRNIELQLDARNLFNVKSYKARYLTANTFSASLYALPGRIIILKFMFSL